MPRLTYAGVEGVFLELVDCSPMRRWAHNTSRGAFGFVEGMEFQNGEGIYEHYHGAVAAVFTFQLGRVRGIQRPGVTDAWEQREQTFKV